ncbi:c-1-tetrahydrofolate synthase cytoplasmic-related [Holotrichia oblita]|nr:c-1-tetrahydrofolate synthase cytoplasmic-related [Holotrichia oblita]
MADLAADFTKKHGYPVCLAIVQVGNNPSSESYVKNNIKLFEQVGLKTDYRKTEESITQAQLEAIIENINKDPHIAGILLQLPLPKHIDERQIASKIYPAKDVDGFNAVSAGNLYLGNDAFVPCTPAGVIELIKASRQPISGKNAVVLGRSNIVGKPMAMLLLKENATVTICHSKTQDLSKVCSKADILVAAIGKAEFVTKDFIKPGAMVLDVGINFTAEGKLVGDCKADEVSEIAGWISPVPGGSGPMTVTMLMYNTYNAAVKLAASKNK